ACLCVCVSVCVRVCACLCVCVSVCVRFSIIPQLNQGCVIPPNQSVSIKGLLYIGDQRPALICLSCVYPGTRCVYLQVTLKRKTHTHTHTHTHTYTHTHTHTHTLTHTHTQPLL